MTNLQQTGQRLTYSVWDRTTRIYHWVNVLCVLILAVFGLILLNEDAIGFSPEGKILLKTLHVYTGYVFFLNLVWRIVWGFVGGRYARWRSLVPLGRGYITALRAYVTGFRKGRAPTYLGHNPAGRLMVTLLLLLMVVQGSTGLVLAGTDLYKPPFGGWIADWVTAGDPAKLSQLQAGSKDHVVPAAYDEMRAFRKPVVTTHVYVFYALMVAILLHIVAVVITEVREKGGLVSAMISGEKSVISPPVDAVPVNAPYEEDQGS